MSTINIPGVGPLVSSALTIAQLNEIWQPLLQQILGIDPEEDALADARVRIDFPEDGQPAWNIGDDVAFIACKEDDDGYDRQHEQTLLPNGDDDTTSIQQTVYTRVIRVSFDFWGPNSWDFARQLKSCVFLDFVHDILAASNLYLITDFAAPQRAPELFASQWWERVHFSVRMNEQVTETLVIPVAASITVSAQDGAGDSSSVTIEL